MYRVEDGTRTGVVRLSVELTQCTMVEARKCRVEATTNQSATP